jgi:uncharacterized protein (DUF488 family)
MAASWNGLVLYTVGHSTRSLDELVELLRSFSVATLVDVRTIPRSRHNPQFNADALKADLPARGIAYRQIADLGGLRKTRADSPNGGWRNASFRGFADYMQTDAFEAGLDELWHLAQEGTAAIQCAEAVPWRCHRSLIADALRVRGADVRHITGRGRASPHRLTSFAQVRGHRITYPANPESASDG